ncbi:hypothetical protein HL666_14615 [Bradyrhizobium sp. 83002]|uniref:hypothetical protein n=1 Tax=Bradyrhizobium aeschynomenes TaxID=2734909 RepID=UPI001551A28C|nr:hypothetical protein [Bradyrhizobium aeschynomenes]NPU12002.1 hypothetical protein [Bradyrhizobium aeschynomenes]
MNKRTGKRQRRRMKSNQQPNASNNAGGVSKNTESGAVQPASQATPSRTPIHHPEAEREAGKPESGKKHWLDYAVGAFSFVAAIGGIAATVGVGVAYFQWGAMIESNRLNREGYSAQTSAFVFANSMQFVTYGAKVDDPNESPRWVISTVLENVGNTPTRHMRSSFDFVWGPAPVSAETFESRDPYKLPFGTGLIGPKSETATGLLILGPTNLTPLQKRQTHVGGIGVIKYQDIFGAPHLTEYCFTALVPPIDFTNFPIGQPIRVKGAFCERHNCADEDCGPDWKQRAQQ